MRAWEKTMAQIQEGAVVTGNVTRKIKGGLLVDVNGINVFLPASQVDIRRPADIGDYIGRVVQCEVLKIDKDRRNIVVSRRSLIERQRQEDREQLLRELEVNQTRKGVVKNIAEFGAFVDLGGIDGLLHITDMAWKRVRHPSEVVNVGDELEVRVLRFDRERNRVSLGLKQLGEDPWTDLARRYPVSTRLFGRVTNITDYGCFVEIEDGVEGLVHVSEMDWTNKNVNPAKVVQTGDEVEVMVLEIDEERRRISLGMKQCSSNPWEAFAATHNKGDRVSGAIKSITDFGIFIGLDGGIDGLVHLSDISWLTPGEESVRNFNKGEEIEAVVLAVDPERERISLGIKQLDQDPFATFMAEHPRGSVVKGTVKEVDARGALIELADGVEGYLRASELRKERVEDATKLLSVGDELEAKFISLDRKSRSLSLSVKALEDDELAEALEEYHQSSGASGTTSLGELLKEQLDQGN
jgi:small subunit ribosomal protein S1